MAFSLPVSRPSIGGHPKLAPLTPTRMSRGPFAWVLRRSAVTYLAIVCLLIFFLNSDVFGAVVISHSGSASKKVPKYRTPLNDNTKTTEFPRKIWQTWKVDPLSFDQRDAVTAKSWTAKNPEYRYEVLTDTNDLTWVEQTYGPEGLGRPDIVELYKTVNATIVKADLLRYLIMYAEGGIYADIDVEALKPVHRFISDHYKEDEIDMVIGIEIDQPNFKDHPILGKKSQSFCQWTFMCKPHLPVMMALVENIMAWLTDLATAQGVPISDIHLDFDEVISGTGPSAFTAAILSEMGRRAGLSSPVRWDRFHDMDESHLVSGILVLDVEAFAAGQGHSDSGNHNARGALVKHHYHASNWPSRHPRFRHPVFGEVERCNWDVACVMKWDADVEAFKALTPDEQQQRIKEAQEPAVPPPADLPAGDLPAGDLPADPAALPAM